jgi:hypothetical protein
MLTLISCGCEVLACRCSPYATVRLIGLVPAYFAIQRSRFSMDSVFTTKRLLMSMRLVCNVCIIVVYYRLGASCVSWFP